ncbi:hypothetical protein ACFYWN_30715 [Streptomyces sp. NPDC002917]|uniref:hypothetical protein n=1 Tax=unclassified Streptomyces TaxID=2593676 RepID=UPI00369293D5
MTADGRHRWTPHNALGEKALVELTTMVAVENMRSRAHSALGLTSQGFKDQCEVPRSAAQRAADSSH